MIEKVIISSQVHGLFAAGGEEEEAGAAAVDVAVAVVPADAESSGCRRSDAGDPPASMELLDLRAATAAASGDEAEPACAVFPCGRSTPAMLPMTACLAAGGSSLDPPTPTPTPLPETPWPWPWKCIPTPYPGTDTLSPTAPPPPPTLIE